MILTSEWQAAAQNRCELYTMASTVFAYESTDDELSAIISAAAAAAADAEGPQRQLYEAIATLRDMPADERGTTVRSEYAELFVGPRPPVAPPYESVYVGFPNRLFTEVTAQVKHYYERYGLTVSKGGRVPDDFIAYELEFMSKLCARELDVLQENDTLHALEIQSAEVAFLMLHLEQWASLFVQRIEDSGASVYYGAWARYVSRLVHEDCAYLKASLAEADDAVNQSSDREGALRC